MNRNLKKGGESWYFTICVINIMFQLQYCIYIYVYMLVILPNV